MVRRIAVIGWALTTCGAISGAALGASYNLKGAPVASFVWSPQLPHIGDPITLTSTSTDLGGHIDRYAWDFADNGPFGAFEEGGPVAGASFATPAPHVVRLKVTDGEGVSDVSARTIAMAPPPASAGVMNPFPIIRIFGRDYAFRVKITQLAVKAPAGARIGLRCLGHRCPIRSAGRRSRSTAGHAKWTPFPNFERFFPAGTIVEIRVSRTSEIGAYTRFHVRRRKLPTRMDSCLDATGIKPIACPRA